MASENITVFIDTNQLTIQKKNKYSLYLAKVVNGVANVIWQTKGYDPINGDFYGYKNTFDINIPSYKINYTTGEMTEGTVTFEASGRAVDVELGQSVTLDINGVFSPAMNTGKPGSLTINNSLPGNPHAILLDHNERALFINAQSGMNRSAKETLTPIDQYQLWFGSHQGSGTIIVDDTGPMCSVTFDGTTAEKTVSFNADGLWQDGPLA